MLAAFRFFWVLSLGLSAHVANAQTQILTPGAAAAGGPTTTLPLIAPDGRRIPILTSGNTQILDAEGQRSLLPSTDLPPPQPTVAEPEILSDGTKIHHPDPDWELSLPPTRGDRGATALSSTKIINTSLPEINPPAAPTAQTPSAPQSLANEQTNATVQVTASATPANAPLTPSLSGSSPTANPEDPLATPIIARLNFGPIGEEVTSQHKVAIDPVETLLRSNPLLPLRVVAVLSVDDAENEAAKQRARRRIVAVRNDILSRGLTADNLTFVISANTETEPYVNFVLIER